jgi:O-antigen/teichoic acid export membrane protein
MTGTTIAQAIPIAISPILTRIYTPEDFGVVALYVALSTILGSLANGSYELAIVLPKKDEDAINIFALGLIITISLSLFFLFIIFIFHSFFLQILGNSEIGFWLYFIPLTVFFTGLFNVLKYFNTRQQNYKDISNVTIVKSIILATLQLSIGLIKQGATGLISAQIIANMFANIKLLKNIIKDKNLISKVSKVKMIALAKKYKKFPKFSLPSTILNLFSYQIVTILLGIFFNTAVVGYYFLANKLIRMPMGVIGNSIGQVFYQELTKLKKDKGAIKKLTLRTIKKLFFLAFMPFLTIIIFGDDIFSLIFGKKWIIAGEYAQMLGVWMMFIFIFSPLSNLCFIFEKQKKVLYFNIMTLSTNILIILIGGIFLEDASQTIALLAIVGVLFWFYWAIFLLQLASINLKDFFYLRRQ